MFKITKYYAYCYDQANRPKIIQKIFLKEVFERLSF